MHRHRASQRLLRLTLPRGTSKSSRAIGPRTLFETRLKMGLREPTSHLIWEALLKITTTTIITKLKRPARKKETLPENSQTRNQTLTQTIATNGVNTTTGQMTDPIQTQTSEIGLKKSNTNGRRRNLKKLSSRTASCSLQTFPHTCEILAVLQHSSTHTAKLLRSRWSESTTKFLQTCRSGVMSSNWCPRLTPLLSNFWQPAQPNSLSAFFASVLASLLSSILSFTLYLLLASTDHNISLASGLSNQALVKSSISRRIPTAKSSTSQAPILPNSTLLPRQSFPTLPRIPPKSKQTSLTKESSSALLPQTQRASIKPTGHSRPAKSPRPTYPPCLARNPTTPTPALDPRFPKPVLPAARFPRISRSTWLPTN